MSFLALLNGNDFDGARSHIADNLLFDGAMGSRNNANVYTSDMRKMQLKYAVQKVFENGDDVCIYDITMSGQ